MTIAPTDIAGLALWLKADQIAGNDGDAITTWADQSGGGLDVTQAVGILQPLLKKVANGINGKNVVRFDGSDVLGRANAAIIQNVASATVFIVLKPANTSQDNTSPFFLSRDASGSTRLAFFIGAGDGKFNLAGRRLDADSFQAIAGGALSTSVKLLTAQVDWANAVLTLFEEGSQTANTNSFQTAGNTSNTASVDMLVGSNTVGFFAGDVAEVVFYVPKIATLDRQRIEWYLAEKYAIAGPTDPDAAVQVATPAISPAAGAILTTDNITITCATGGASIYYTIDGSTPDATKTLYSGAFNLAAGATVKAIGIKAAMTDSAVASSAFTIATVATPGISPNGGSFVVATAVTLTCATSGASIYYTTDGSTPDATKTLYTVPFTLSADATVKAIGIKAGLISSAVASAAFTITIPAAAGGGNTGLIGLPDLTSIT